MESIGGGHIEQVTLGIKISMPRLHDGAFKESFVPYARDASKPKNRFLMKTLNLSDRQKYRIAHDASLRMSSA